MNELILIVEDDQDLRLGLRDNFEFEGYSVDDAWNFTHATEKWRLSEPSLVILDLMLPGRSGYQILKEMRSSGYNTPVIILTARGELSDKVKGFRLGCDDYLIKPFSIIELLMRVKALLRRSVSETPTIRKIELNSFVLDIENHSLTVLGNVHKLTLKEVEVLRYFLENSERVITRQALLTDVWNSPPEIDTRTVDVCVSNLRKKIIGSGCEIQTVYKAGYRWKTSET